MEASRLEGRIRETIAHEEEQRTKTLVQAYKNSHLLDSVSEQDARRPRLYNGRLKSFESPTRHAGKNHMGWLNLPLAKPQGMLIDLQYACLFKLINLTINNVRFNGLLNIFDNGDLCQCQNITFFNEVTCWSPHCLLNRRTTDGEPEKKSRSSRHIRSAASRWPIIRVDMGVFLQRFNRSQRRQAGSENF